MNGCTKTSLQLQFTASVPKAANISQAVGGYDKKALSRISMSMEADNGSKKHKKN